MGQNSYADVLINAMLGWVRWLADRVWELFQFDQNRNWLASWFLDNWLAFIVVLILVGLVLDWVIWMLRWRPYRLWFGGMKRPAEDEDIGPRRQSPARRAAPPKRRPSVNIDDEFAFDDIDLEESMGEPGSTTGRYAISHGGEDAFDIDEESWFEDFDADADDEPVSSVYPRENQDAMFDFDDDYLEENRNSGAQSPWFEESAFEAEEAQSDLMDMFGDVDSPPKKAKPASKRKYKAKARAKGWDEE